MTDIPSREYFERIISDMDRRLSQALDEHERRTQLALTEARRAVDKAEEAIEARLILLNEFRQQSADRDRSFVSRIEFAALKEIVDRMSGKQAGVASGIAVALAVIAIIVNFISG